MTNELTLRKSEINGSDLREKILSRFTDRKVASELISEIAKLLEDTGSPAHMRVAKELREE